MADFYLIVAPGLELQALNEIKEVWPYLIAKDGKPQAQMMPRFELDRGGIEFTLDEFTAYQFNFFLKTPTRLLQRMRQFRSKDFPRVYQELSKVSWSQFLKKESPIAFKVSAQKSRLNNEKRLEGVLEDVFKKAGYKISESSEAKEAPKDLQTIYLRMDDDFCSVSLDTSGDFLYRRGWGSRKGEAPMRETLAAFCLRELLAETPLPRAKTVTLLDPFCGSGTLLLEAASLYFPHWDRDFAFLHFANAPKLFKSPTWKKNYRLPMASPFLKMLGNDGDAKTLMAAKDNAKDLEHALQQTWSTEPDAFRGIWQWQQGLCHDWDIEPAGPVWIVSNPPYGDRVSLLGGRSLRDELAPLVTKSKAEKIALLLPTEEAKALEFEGFVRHSNSEISNGGLQTVWTVWCKI